MSNLTKYLIATGSVSTGPVKKKKMTDKLISFIFNFLRIN